MKVAVTSPADAAVAESAPKEAFTKAFSAISAAKISTRDDNRSVSVDSSLRDDKGATTDSLGPEFDDAEKVESSPEAPLPVSKAPENIQTVTKKAKKQKKKKTKKKQKKQPDDEVSFPFDEAAETEPSSDQTGPEMDEPVEYAPPMADFFVTDMHAANTSPLQTSKITQPRQLKLRVPVHDLPSHPPAQLTNVEDAFERLNRLKDRLRSLKVLMDTKDQSTGGPKSLEAEQLLAYYQNGGDHPFSSALANISRELENVAKADGKKPSPIDEAYGALLRAQAKLRSLRALAKARKPY